MEIFNQLYSWLTIPIISWKKGLFLRHSDPKVDLVTNQALVGHKILEIKEDQQFFKEDKPGPLPMVWKTSKDDKIHYWRIQTGFGDGTLDRYFGCVEITIDEWFNATHSSCNVLVTWKDGTADEELANHLRDLGFSDATLGLPIWVIIRGTSYQIAKLKYYYGPYLKIIDDILIPVDEAF